MTLRSQQVEDALIWAGLVYRTSDGALRLNPNGGAFGEDGRTLNPQAVDSIADDLLKPSLRPRAEEDLDA